jgi:hypothetical protein
MFVGFTPGIASLQQPFVNPKYSKIFKMEGGGHPLKDPPFVTLSGRNIVDGLRQIGYYTLGSGAAAWFNDQTPTGRTLTADFHHFYHPGNVYSLPKQLSWIAQRLDAAPPAPVFLFLNVGETHVPYYYEGAPWPRTPNPCRPFSEDNDADACRVRQLGCLEFVDRQLEGLLERFSHANILVCADHGDAWGEDGLWEHGIHHPTVTQVPLLFRLQHAPRPAARLLPRRGWRRLRRRVSRLLAPTRA